MLVQFDSLGYYLQHLGNSKMLLADRTGMLMVLALFMLVFLAIVITYGLVVSTAVACRNNRPEDHRFHHRVIMLNIVAVPLVVFTAPHPATSLSLWIYAAATGFYVVFDCMAMWYKIHENRSMPRVGYAMIGINAVQATIGFLAFSASFA